MRSELGSVQSGKSLPEVSEERFGEFVVDSNHSEEYIFKLTYGYINQSTVNSEEATIVKTYLERKGFPEWFAKKAKAHKAAQRSQEILQNLKKIINEDVSSSNSSDYSWQQVDMSPPGNSLGNGDVRLTEENIPYADVDRQKVCKVCNNVTRDHCNVVGHKAGDLVCPNVQNNIFSA